MNISSNFHMWVQPHNRSTQANQNSQHTDIQPPMQSNIASSLRYGLNVAGYFFSGNLFGIANKLDEATINNIVRVRKIAAAVIAIVALSVATVYVPLLLPATMSAAKVLLVTSGILTANTFGATFAYYVAKDNLARLLGPATNRLVFSNNVSNLLTRSSFSIPMFIRNLCVQYTNDMFNMPPQVKFMINFAIKVAYVLSGGAIGENSLKSSAINFDRLKFWANVTKFLYATIVIVGFSAATVFVPPLLPMSVVFITTLTALGVPVFGFAYDKAKDSLKELFASSESTTVSDRSLSVSNQEVPIYKKLFYCISLGHVYDSDISDKTKERLDRLIKFTKIILGIVAVAGISLVTAGAPIELLALHLHGMMFATALSGVGVATVVAGAQAYDEVST